MVTYRIQAHSCRQQGLVLPALAALLLLSPAHPCIRLGAMLPELHAKRGSAAHCGDFEHGGRFRAMVCVPSGLARLQILGQSMWPQAGKKAVLQLLLSSVARVGADLR